MGGASPYYNVLVLGAIVVSLVVWTRMARTDERLVLIYFAGLAGAFIGAKALYLVAEGWLHWGEASFWLQAATGKSIVGALLGGYAGVEGCKAMIGYRGTTGDRFAWMAPLGILAGRMGCLMHGCCLGRMCDPAWYTMEDGRGQARWPAVPVEMLFNAEFLVVLFLGLRGNPRWTGQQFHVYLVAYGIFRLLHETARETPRILGPFTGYQVAAGALVVLGAVRFRQRARAQAAGLARAGDAGA